MARYGKKASEKVEKAMHEIYAATEIDFNIYVSGINAEGVKVKKTS